VPVRLVLGILPYTSYHGRVLKILLTGVKGKAEYGGDVTVYQVIGIHSTYPDDGGRRKT
jgi:hypothetical protein